MMGGMLEINKELYRQVSVMNKDELKNEWIRLKKVIRDGGRLNRDKSTSARDQIWMFRRRLFKMRREIDFLLKHQYSTGANMKTITDKTGGKNGSKKRNRKHRK